MALRLIDKQSILDLRRQNDTTYDVVLLASTDCAACAEWATKIEALSMNYVDRVDFWRYNIDESDVIDSLPIWAPPVIPSLIGMIDGWRSWEGLGALETTDPIEAMIDDWLGGYVNINNISGAQSVVPG